MGADKSIDRCTTRASAAAIRGQLKHPPFQNRGPSRAAPPDPRPPPHDQVMLAQSGVGLVKENDAGAPRNNIPPPRRSTNGRQPGYGATHGVGCVVVWMGGIDAFNAVWGRGEGERLGARNVTRDCT